MLRLDETPEDRGSPPPSPWGGSPSPSQPGTPSPEARPRLLSERGGAGGGGDPQIGAPPGDPPPARGRSRSAPPVLWAAQRYGRRLRRMSDEFQLQGVSDRGGSAEPERGVACPGCGHEGRGYADLSERWACPVGVAWRDTKAPPPRLRWRRAHREGAWPPRWGRGRFRSAVPVWRSRAAAPGPPRPRPEPPPARPGPASASRPRRRRRRRRRARGGAAGRSRCATTAASSASASTSRSGSWGSSRRSTTAGRRRSRSWRSTWMSCWTWRATAPAAPACRRSSWTVTNPPRRSWGISWRRFGGCRNSTPPRRNDPKIQGNPPQNPGGIPQNSGEPPNLGGNPPISSPRPNFGELLHFWGPPCSDNHAPPSPPLVLGGPGRDLGGIWGFWGFFLGFFLNFGVGGVWGCFYMGLIKAALTFSGLAPFWSFPTPKKTPKTFGLTLY